MLQPQDTGPLEEVAIDTTGVHVDDAVTAVGDVGDDGGALTAAAGTLTAAQA